MLCVGGLAEHLSLDGMQEGAHRLDCLGGTGVGVTAASSTTEAASATTRREAAATTAVTSSTSASTERHAAN